MASAKEPKFSNATNSFTPEVFRIRNSISRSQYYKMMKAGTGPRVMFLSERKPLITAEAEREWVRARSRPARGAALRLQKAQAELRAAKSHYAGQRSAASPKHVSKRIAAAAKGTRP
jgi:hypothetical protein